MRKRRKLNVHHLLLTICFGLILASFLLPHTGNLQMEISVLAIILYVTFSLVHHYFDKTLTMETTIEYILVATLALIVSIGVLS